MDEHTPLSRETGRQTPAQGVKISLAGPTIVLLTVNTKDRLCWLNQPKVQASLETIWRAADAWLVGYYLLMPDHLHLFCAPRNLAFTLEQWMSYWKSQFSRVHLDEPWAWQRSGFHHRLRHADEYHIKWNYVRENPLRKGLVTRSEDWSCQGVIHDLRW